MRWGDMDALGHVNNVAYFVYCESARMAFFAALELESYSEGGRQGPALVSASCTFRQQVRHPATLEVGVRVARIGGRSFTLDYGLYRRGEEEPVAEGSSVVVWIDYAAGKALPLPTKLRSALEARAPR
ncbi:MAG: acyl-CoA thioesterase [Planctomycetota bacterium]|nr:MAG: acyl-CoA thioesterase [Planctomycetota bacterium]